MAIFLSDLSTCRFRNNVNRVTGGEVRFLASMTRFNRFNHFGFSRQHVHRLDRAANSFDFASANQTSRRSVFQNRFVTRLFIRLRTAPTIARDGHREALNIILTSSILVRFTSSFT